MGNHRLSARPLWGRPFVPREIALADNALPIAVQAIFDLIDMTDPAWPGVAAVLREFTAAGIEIDAKTAAMAVSLGRRRWAEIDGGDVQPTLASATGSIVYYIRRGALIKIGTTTQPQTRFRDLMPDEILAVEPGDRKQEAARHRQFSYLRGGGKEYFRDAPELLGHIRAVRAMYGEPDPSWSTTAGRKEHWRLPLASSIDILTTAEAEAQLGIRQNTIRAWRSRGRIEPAGRDERRRLLFYREHLIRLRDSTRARLADGF